MVNAEKRVRQILTELGHAAPDILNERQQRIISGSITKGYGYADDKIISAAFRLDQRTVFSGRKAVEPGKIDNINR